MQPDDVFADPTCLVPELRNRSQRDTHARLCKLAVKAMRVTRMRGHSGYVGKKIVISNDDFEAVAE